jgi:Glycine-rich domain-containing protein-like
MVWHAHLLNPRAYLQDCIRGAKMQVWATDFPWKLVDDAIDSQTFDYDPGEEAKQHFEKTAGRPWNNLDEPEQKTINCLACTAQLDVPWTSGELGASPDSAFKYSTGYADTNFAAYCTACNHKHDKHALRVARFNKDVYALLSKDQPMPGTYLDFEGIPSSLVEFYGFPNLLIKQARRLVLDSTDPGGNIRSMTNVKNLMEELMADPKLIMGVNARPSLKLSRTQKISIRRMMSHYWENSSPFALDLVGAVIRQGTFIQKMDNIDWIHSPALSATMDRLIRKYGIFFDIMIDNRGKMAVPTLDVDLAWHTHQMSPYRYCNYSKTKSLRHGTQIFIDHDDKVEEGALSDAFQWTSKQYMKVTNGELYSECTCWYCEASRESFLYPSLPFPSSSTRRSRNLVEGLHDDPNISSEPDKNPHISAHNAVPTDSTNTWDERNASLKAMRLRQMWAKAHRRAQKRQKKQGKVTGANGGDRNRSTADPGDPYYPMIYGYPFFVPYYAPYMADPGINSAIYPCNPACMSAGVASYGNWYVCCSSNSFSSH